MTALGRIAFCIAFLVAAIFPIHAQDTALQVGSTVDGSLSAGETHRYSFVALEFTLVSFRVEALAGELDPVLEVFDSSGDLIVSNDDYDYPDSRDAALQAFVFPQTGTYTVAVSAFGESGGDYRLHLLPGYDKLALHDKTMNPSNWEVVYSDALVNLSESSAFAVDMRGLARSAVLLGLHLPIEQELYYEAAFEQVRSPVIWQVGLVFRYLSPTTYHRLLFSKRGYWRVDRVDGDNVTQLRYWTTHPAIRPGESDFRLGVLVSGQHYDIVYNGQFVGSAWDRSPLQPGSVGIAMKSDETFGGQVSFVVRETIITVPTRVDDKILFPQRLVAKGYNAMVDVLARQQLVPVGGEVKVSLLESSVRRVRPGITRLPVASDLSFAVFAFGVSLVVEGRSGANGGCGLYFHYNDDENYTLAYLTGGGDYGLSRRAGVGFEPGIYGSRPVPEEETRYLLVIVSDEVIHLYLDEQYAGTLENQPRIGGVGVAAVNYEETNTACLFEDLWILNLDN